MRSAAGEPSGRSGHRAGRAPRSGWVCWGNCLGPGRPVPAVKGPQRRPALRSASEMQCVSCCLLLLKNCAGRAKALSDLEGAGQWTTQAGGRFSSLFDQCGVVGCGLAIFELEVVLKTHAYMAAQ